MNIGLDINSILREYDEKQRSGGSGTASQPAQALASKPPAQESGTAPPPSRAEEIVDNTIGDASRERQIRNAASDAEKAALLERAAGKQLEKDGPKIEATAYQRRAVAMLMNSLNVRNAQAVIAISNREGIRKGLSKEPEIQKPVGRGQLSTVAIPTALLRYVQQEIGPLSGRTSQNDVVTGFLYWYFGQPQEVSFPSPDSAAKAAEIVSNLDLNASPAKFNRVNYNMSGNLLERLDEIRDRLDAVAAWMQTDMKDSVASRVQADKSYIALCYLILSFSALAPPVMPGQGPEDIDVLAQGGVWDLMSGLDDAYDYFRAKNGREIYKAKHGIKPAPKFRPRAPEPDPDPFDAGPGMTMYGPGDGDADDNNNDGGSMYTGDDGEGYREIEPLEDYGGLDGAFGDDGGGSEDSSDTSYESFDAEAGDAFMEEDPIQAIKKTSAQKARVNRMLEKLSGSS